MMWITKNNRAHSFGIGNTRSKVGNESKLASG